VARQPILDAKQEGVGDELLFRSSLENVLDARSPDHATSSVIADAFLVFGLDQLTGGKPAFLNFSRPFLVGDFWQLLPRDRIVVEVLETITPDDEVIAACRRLEARGHTLALDDFSWSEAYRPLVELADVIEVDFVVTRGRRRAGRARQAPFPTSTAARARGSATPRSTRADPPQRGKSPRRNASPSRASASWLGASGRQIAAAAAMVWHSGVNDSITQSPA
jgi:hypothetical protein